MRRQRRGFRRLGGEVSPEVRFFREFESRGVGAVEFLLVIASFGRWGCGLVLGGYGVQEWDLNWGLGSGSRGLMTG